MSIAPINLSQLPVPSIVETLDYSAILASMIADLQSRDSAFTALIESDPAYKIIEVCAYRETLIRERVNLACQGVMLAYAVGANLDQIGANYGVKRNIVTPANPFSFPPTPAVMESDSAFRNRIQLSLDGYSTAGPSNAYLFWALSVPTIKDASIVGPPTVSPGNVLVTIMSNASTSGVATSDEIAAVTAALNADTVRPLTDLVTVASVAATNYTITASVFCYSGPDTAVVMAAANASAQAYIAAQRFVGRSIYLSALYAAISVTGVAYVEMSAPTADIVIDYQHVSYCTAVFLTLGGVV